MALLGLGCGDDSVAADAAVDSPVDHAMADHPTTDTPPTPDAGPSVTIAAAELHGTVPVGGNLVPIMKAAVSISTTPSDFVPDFGTGAIPGCSAFAFDVGATPPKLPPPTYDIGNIVLTMYSGQPVQTLQATTTCTFSGGSYGCDFPDVGNGRGVIPEVDTGGNPAPAHWIAVGDRLNFNWAGGAGIGAFNMQIPASNPAEDNFSDTVTASQGTVNPTGCTGGTAVDLQNGGANNVFAFDQDLLVKFNCGGQPCRLVAVSMFAGQSDAGKGASLTCTALLSDANSSCVKIPAGALGVLNYSGWSTAPGAQIQTSVLHFGLGFTQESVSGSSATTIGAARGQFFIRVP
jgi:hypothetical protein